MRKIVTLALMMTVVCACGSTHSQIDVRGKGRIYVGMSNDKLSEVMGEPDSVGRGKYGCHHDANFFGFTPGEQTIEWSVPTGAPWWPISTMAPS